MGSQTLEIDGSPVVAEVEVIYFNLSKKRGLLAGALAKGVGGRRALLRGPIGPGEQPAATAHRLLQTVAGVTTGAHEPALVSARCAPHRQMVGPTLTLSYVVVGSTPTNSTAPWIFSEEVDRLDPPLDERVDDADAVRAARNEAVRLLEALPLAPRLLTRAGEPFTLVDLHWVYSAVIGPGWRTDLANFRRKVERVPGLVKRVDAPQSGHTQQSKRGRRPIWYTQGKAERIDAPIRFE